MPTLLIASFFVAGIARVMPGDALQTYLGTGREVGTTLGDRELEILKARLGLDDPFVVQYVRFILGWPDKEGRVVRSGFGAETWRELGEFAADPVTDLTFITNRVGWSVGKHIIWGSSDAGTTWTPQDTSGEIMTAVAAADEQHVWVIGRNGFVMGSAEGGRPPTATDDKRDSSWAVQPSGVTQDLNDIVALDTQRLWIVGNDGVILATDNGGESWTQQSSGTQEHLRAVAFNAQAAGVAVGDNGTVLHTVDGSAWRAVGSGATENLRSVAFVGARALAVGDAGALVMSLDEGASWRSSRPAYREVTFRSKTAEDVCEPGDSGCFDEITGEDLAGVIVGRGDVVEAATALTSVGLLEDMRGYISGEGGLFLETADGGDTWTQLPLLDKNDEPLSPRNLVSSWPIVDERSGNIRYFIASYKDYWRWGAVGGNLGESLVGTRTVTEDLSRTLAPTLQLGIMTILLATAVAIPLGIISAVRQDTWMDYVGRTVAIGGLAIPSFWLGTLVLVLPNVIFNWSPPLQYIFFFKDPVANLRFFAIPVLVGGLFGSASVMRMTRSMMLEVLRQDYVRTAWSKGLRERVVIYRHALKNALIPVVTIIGMQVPLIVGGLVVIERLFSITGIGRLLLDAVRLRDYPVIQGINLFFAAMVLFSNLIVDVTYGWLDPRIHYS